MTRAEQIETLRQFPDRLAELVDDLTTEQLTTPYLDGEWTVAQNVHHCADSHMNSFTRLKLILTEDNPTLRPYDQNAWAELTDTTTPAVETSLLLLKGLHARWVMLFEHLTDAQWQRTGYHPELDTTLTPADLLASYADHCRAHLDQITRTLAAQK